MENIQKAILTLLHYNTIIRDTLEYTVKKKEYNIEHYNFKKRGVLVEIEQNTPLKIFLDKAGENGEKLLAKIKDFFEEVYSDKSTILQLSGDQLRVDHAQHLTIFEHVILIHEEIFRITKVHTDYAKNLNLFEDRFRNLIKADERFYRSLVYMTLLEDLEALFLEFNKARNEAKGKETPQSNFIQNDISKITNLLGFSRQNTTITDLEFMEIVDSVFHLLENISGKRDLPIGKTFSDVFKEARFKVNEFVRKTETIWRDLYRPIMDEFVKQSTKPVEPGEA
ncbi:MAG: hypothetical protein WCZ47_04775 [Bacilli bacterium]|jgi:hypothetical protein|nr:hypothetical protein [Erysipelotrichia bacterium]